MGDIRMVRYSWHVDGMDDPPDDSVVGTPPRRPASLRRTAHINASWPDGFGTPVRLEGRARDLVTPASGDPIVRSEDDLRLDIDLAQTIVDVAISPARERTADLVGTSSMRGFRATVDATLADDRARMSPLAFLLDDVPPVSMIGGIAWAQHRAFDIPIDKDSRSFQRTPTGRIACSGLRPGGYQEQSLDRGVTFPHWVRPAGDLSSDDPWAWHEIHPASESACFRRRRRVDAWQDGRVLQVDAHFRDSVWGPDRDEIALHEYTVMAAIDAGSGVLQSIDVGSRVLPFPECPAAAGHAQDLVGTEVAAFRSHVRETLTELHACTHLNDMLRGLSDIPALVRSVELIG